MSDEGLPMRSLGIDLASQLDNTAACAIDWLDGRARVVDLVPRNVSDDKIIDLADRSNVIGIDAPFGWPTPFVELMQQHHERQPRADVWCNDRRDALRFRRTDHRVRQSLNRWPLSVSSDLIAIVAMRCAGLLDRLEVRDRSGDGRVFETYPAVALAVWGLPSRGYKSVAGAEIRRQLVEVLVDRCPWLAVPAESASVCVRSDHALDALLASLVARAAACGLTEQPTEAERAAAAIEGWIAIPKLDSLARLVADPLRAADVSPTPGDSSQS